MPKIVECESIIPLSDLNGSLQALIRGGTLQCASGMACERKLPIVEIHQRDISCVGPQSDRCPKKVVTEDAI